MAAQLVLLALLATISAYSLSHTLSGSGYWNPPIRIPYSDLLLGIPIEASAATMATLIIFVPCGLFIALNASFGFRISALAGTGFQMPALLASGRLDWSRFIGFGGGLKPGMSQPEVFALLAGYVVVLFMMARLISQLKRQVSLEAQGVERAERFGVLAGDFTVTCGLAVLSLVVTAVVISIGNVISGAEELFTQLPWMVLTIGLIVMALTATFLMTWVQLERRG